MVHFHWLFTWLRQQVRIVMSGNKELTKTIESLAESVKSIKDELQTLKHSAIQNGSNPQSSVGTQQSKASISTGGDPEWRRRIQRQTRNQMIGRTHRPHWWRYQTQHQHSLKRPLALSWTIKREWQRQKDKARPIPSGSDVRRSTKWWRLTFRQQLEQQTDQPADCSNSSKGPFILDLHNQDMAHSGM